MNLEIKNFTINLTRKKIKNINLRIKNTGEINLTAPLKISLKEINHFLNSKYEWIKKHYEILQQRRGSLDLKPSELISKEQIHFQGSLYQLKIFESTDKLKVELNQDELHLHVKPESTVQQKQQVLTAWYRIQMQELLPALFDKWQSIIGVSASKISIKKMTSRWGSCNPSNRHISLNLTLIERPLICLEYVIVHELVHLLEASHNARFYSLMDYYLPNWQQIRKDLRSHQPT